MGPARRHARPVLYAHNDYTVKAGPSRVRDLVGAETDHLLERRFSFINVWRPIKGPLYDAPLAVCDARTVALEEFILTENRFSLPPIRYFSRQ